MQKNLPGSRLSRWLVVVFMALLSTSAAWAQSTANYAFTTSSTGSLVDMTTGTTSALATGAYRDDDASTVQPIGFAFVFMGTPYTQFSVNSNGQLRLGATVISGTYASAATGAAILAPIGGDNAMQATGKVVYKVVPGTNRTLVVEWTGLRIPYAVDPATGTPTQVQVVLEENTGKVEYRYGTFYNNSTGVSRTIFISAGVTAGKIGVVKTFTTAPTYDATPVSTTVAASLTSLPDNAAVPVLSSTADGSRAVLTFTPTLTPAAPTVAFSAVTQIGLSVDITDNSTTEYTFSVYRSTDNVTFTFLGALTTSSTTGTGTVVSLAQTGLTAGTPYYYRVVANAEGASSTAATATITTPAAVPLCGTKTVGPAATANYPTLTAAFTALNNNGLCGPLVFELQADYVSTTETFPIAYTYTGATATNTVTVRPAAGATNLSITGTTAAAVFNIVGGKYLILDGRPGGSGSTVSGAAQATDLTIASTNTGGVPLQFTSDATFNLVQHCQIKGVGTSDSGSPDVNFTGTVTTTGNSDNTIQYSNIGDGATTPVTLVYGGNALNSRNSLLNNNLFNNYGTASTYGIYLNQSGAGWNISGNSFYQTANRVNVSGTMYGIFINANNNHTVSGNFVGGSAPSLGGTPLTVTLTSANAAAAYRFVGIYLATTTGTASNVQGNTVGNIAWVSSSGATTTYGILSGIYISSGDVNVGTTTGNIVGGAAAPITVSSTTSAGYVFGISTASSGAISITGNTISNITGLGTASVAVNVAGILSSTGSPTINRNKIYNLAAGSAASGTVATLANGIWLTGGTLNTVTNNLIGDLRAATSTSLVAVSGILVAGGTTNNVYYNTVNLAASSTGTTFGTSGIYLNSTSATLDLRNNIVVNKSTAVGTGGYTAALRRVSGTAGTVPSNLAATTNNNLYYAGTPSATNLIYVEGTTTATNAQQTVASYKIFVATRESNSVTEDVPFLSTTGTAATFLHINPAVATQVEGNATPITSVTTDFDGDTRSTTAPDLGADEGTFIPQDVTPPSIAYTPLVSSNSTANRTLVVTVSDASGVATGALAPRLFFRKGTTGAYTSVLATTVSGNTYTFTLDYALVGGATGGDVIQYYVAAQDLATPANSGTNPLGGTYTTAPATPNSYTIFAPLSGIYYVGSGTSPNAARTFTTLTAAAAAYNGSNLTGAVTFLLLDNSYGTAETFPIVFNANADASATNTLTIRPNTGVTATITGSVVTGAVLKLNGADYITIDGSNTGGTSQNLTITNTSATGTGNAVIWLAAASATDGATFNTVKNTLITGNSAAGFPQFVVFLGGGGATATSPTTSTPVPNSNNTITNNVISRGYYGVFAYGVSATSLDQSNVVSGNQLGSGTGNGFGQEGIRGVYQQGLSLVGNEIQNITNGTTTANLYGIFLADSKGVIASRNSVHGISYTGTSTTKVWGINSSTTTFTTAANASANRFDNNLVYGLNSTATSSTWNTVGINCGGGYGDQYYYNTVYLSGQLSAASGTAGSAAFANGNPSVTTVSTNIDVRNNIFSIIGGTGGTTSTPLYAHYTYGTTYTGSTLDYNDLFVTAGATGLAVVGHLGTSTSPTGDYATLALWQTATSQEANSKSVNPLFVQTTTVPYNLAPTNVDLNNAGTPIAGITTDYTGATRGALPDIGAIEFSPPAIDLSPVALVAPTATSACYGSAEPVSVSIRNTGLNALNFASNAATITVVVTPPSGTALPAFTTTIATGTLASGATQTITLPTTLNMGTVGTYTFRITATVAGDGNTSNDVLTPDPTRTVAAPVVGTLSPATTSICVSGTVTLTLAGAANGITQFQSSPDNVTFTDIAGANGTTYTTPVLTSTTYFRAQVRCTTGTVTSNVSTITVNNPLVASTNTPLTICSGSTATLTATPAAGSSVRFFSAATGGTALATAGSYTTPALTASTTYYVEAFTPSTSVAGLADNSAANGTFAQSTATDYPLGFAVSQAGTLASVDVYPTAAGTLTIRLYSVSGTQPSGTATAVAGSDVTITVTAAQVGTKVTVPLNYALTAGDYKLSNFAGGLGRYSTYTGTYPLTSADGTLTVKGSYTFYTSTSYSNTTYNSFFNLTFVGECVSATRTPIQVNVTQPATASFPAATASTCSTSPYQLAGTVTGSATTGTYTTSGTGTFSPNATTLNATYTPSAADIAAGSVTITLTSAATAPCTATTTATLALSISSPAVATFSYPTGTTYCAGSAGTVTPTLGTGATAGTFTSTTGLTINATTGVITLSTSTAGTYTVTNTVAANGACAAVTATATVTVTPAASAAFSYAAASFCQTGTNPTPTVTGTAGGTFSSTTGLTLNATTGAITLSTSTVGTYTVTYTVAGACGASATATVTITTGQSAAFSYPTGTTYCAGSAGTVTPTLATGSTAGTFSSTTGLTINATTGVITLSTSTAGTYTVTNTVAANGGCAAATATTTVTVTPATSAAFSYAAASFCQTGTNPTPTVTGTAGGTFSSTTGLSINATTGLITLSASTPGTYTVTYTVAGACGSSATASITITTGQVATFSYPATGSNCAGSTGTVSPTLATGATAGTFTSTAGLTISATTGVVNLATSTAGTYTVTNTVAASGGCAATTATATITVNPTPARPTLTPTYNGTQTTLTSSSATGNQYYYNGVAITGATGQTYVVNGSATTYGSYTVVVTNSFGCSSQASVATVVTTTRQGIAGASIQLYPNPTPTGQVTLELSGFRSVTQLTVIDALGRVVRTETLPAATGTVTHALDLSRMASGVYMLRLTNADGVETRRLTRE